eukprot:CAMPEP_0196802306 /NCGR_PEP_ID=MMETSP1362-20130617/1935_1 /TAXON_ID=163516 /ORGANISM="Leptocylindrus danicus, Strain CCMP1856" /LENGTH=142 /DNA_ID=CAMNT_0042173563 /DNA_START=324 /DNA_END=749 /DNA_ORIENTATION=-
MSSSNSSNGQNNNNYNNNNNQNGSSQQGNNNNNNSNRFQPRQTSASFTGSCPEMKGYTITYQAASVNSTQYEPWKKALTQMAGRFEKEPGDIKYAVEHMEDPKIPEAKKFDDVQAEVLKQFGGVAPTEAEKFKYEIFTKSIS